jgi:hypothetical protein
MFRHEGTPGWRHTVERMALAAPTAGDGIGSNAFHADPRYSAAVNETRRLLGLRVGAIKQRAELVPIKQYWCGSAQPWVTGVESLDTLQTQEDWV